MKKNNGIFYIFCLQFKNPSVIITFAVTLIAVKRRLLPEMKKTSQRRVFRGANVKSRYWRQVTVLEVLSWDREQPRCDA